MKRMLSLMILLSLILSIAGCNKDSEKSVTNDSITSYQDVPGVTQEEIDAIEGLKAKHGNFTYGHLVTTESFRQTDGSYGGFTIEVCKLLSDLFDTQFSPKAYNEWTDLKDDIDNCITDFSGEFTHTAERMQLYEMTTPVAGRGLSVYNLTSAPEITTHTDINGMRVGFLNSAVAVELIMKLYPDSSFEVVDIPGFNSAAEMLHSGEIDAFVTDGVSDTMFDEYDDIRSREIFQFAYAPVSITTKDPEFQPIISVINKYLDAGGMETMFRLYREGSYEYKKHKLYQSFTDEERAYLADLKQRNAQVNAVLMHDAYPASFYNAVEKRYDGAAYDILAEVSELTGIEFNSDCMPVEKPLSDILAKLESGEISMMPQLLYSESRKNDYIWSDVSYITTNFALLSKNDYPNLQPFQVYYATVGTVNNSVHEEVFKELFPEHEKMIAYQTGDEAFDALERGEIDLLMLAETMLLVQTNYRENLGYKVNISFDKTLDTLFGFNKDEVVLRDIFDKSLAYIDIKGIEENWLSRAFDYQSKMLRDSLPFIILFVVLLLVALFVVFLFFMKNRKINKNLEETVKERTHELENKTATLSTIYNSIPDLVFCKDVNGIFTSCNPSFEKFAGMTEAELAGKSDREVFKIDAEMDQTILSGQKAEIKEELTTYPDGSQRLMETVRTPLIQNNEVIGMVGISRDITERKEAETILEKRLEQQELMAALSQNFIYNADTAETINKALQMTGKFMDIGRILLIQYENRALCYQYEWCNPSSRAKHKLGTILPVDDLGAKLTADLSRRLITHFNLDDNDREGFVHYYNLEDIETFLMLPVYADDEFWGVLEFDQCEAYVPWTTSDINLGKMIAGVLSGVITRQNMEARLVEAKELAEQNSRAKSDFLSRMSHEMRTPMNAIIGMTSIGRGSDDIERKDYCLGKIDSASTHLLGVINDVLDISKIEAGKFELSNTDFNLEKMLIKITNVVNFRMEEKGQCFTIKIDRDVPQAIVSDEQRLNQVITNLIGNAVKFTPDNGTISLFVRRIKEENGVHTLQFEVKDTGIGISEEQQKKLFTLFEQGDGSVSRKYGGTGLGLAISKHIVEMMGGQIWVESRIGEGSRFFFSIRVEEGHYQANPLRSDINLRDLRILAVDDEEDVREYFLSLAKAHELQCEVAASGMEACEMIDTRGSYDVFFIDWKMDGMDGIELTKWIKNKYSNNSVVIMISGADWTEVESEAKQAGVDRFISKPLFASVVIECICECVNTCQNEVLDHDAELSEREHFEGMRILLAEDIDINREIIVALLEPTGIQIDCAEDGGIAYRMFQEDPTYDMIFMDIHMPEVDGYTSTKMIRALPDPRARTVPIIAMTANVFREDIEKCLDAGMNAHVGKPIDIEDVMTQLRRYLLQQS